MGLNIKNKGVWKWICWQENNKVSPFKELYSSAQIGVIESHLTSFARKIENLFWWINGKKRQKYLVCIRFNKIQNL